MRDWGLAIAVSAKVLTMIHDLEHDSVENGGKQRQQWHPAWRIQRAMWCT